jgi:cytochrome c551
MSTRTGTSWVRPRARPGIGALLVAVAFAGTMLLGSTSWQGPTASQAATISASAQAQAAGCFTATNAEHADAGRAWELLIFVFARGSFDYLGLSWARTSIQEGPTGTWNMVENCGGGTTTTSTTVPSTTTTTTGSTTTTSTTVPSTTTTTVAPPDGAAIYQANCAACHGAEGQGGVGPSLQGIGEVHTVQELAEVITNGRGAMPAWQGRLTPEEINAVATYVSTIPGEHTHDH